MKTNTPAEGARKALDWLGSKNDLPERIRVAFDRLGFDTANFFDKLEAPRLRELYWEIEKLRTGPMESRDNKKTAELLKEFAEVRLEVAHGLSSL